MGIQSIKGKYTVSCLGGATLGLGFIFPNLWLLMFVGITAAVFLVVDRRWGIKDWKQEFFSGWLFGFVFLGIVHTWLWQMLPLDWLGVSNIFVGVTLVFFQWFVLVVFLALFIGLWFLAGSLSPFPMWGKTLLLPAMWAGLEYFRMWGFSVLTLGAGSLLGPHYSVGALGYGIADVELFRRLAAVGGVYLLSALVVVGGLLMYYAMLDAISRRVKRETIVGALLFTFLLVISVCLGIGDGEGTSKRTLSTALVTTYFPSALEVSKEERSIRFERHLELVRDAFEHESKPDVIILPEAAGFLRELQWRGQLGTLSEMADGREVVVVDSGHGSTDVGEKRLRIFYYNTRTQDITTSDKQFLVSEGEYTPYLARLFLLFIGKADVLDQLDTFRAFSKGEEAAVGRLDEITIGTRFCSEILSPKLYADIVKEHDPDILVNISSQSWFHGSKILSTQLRRMAQLRAVENGRPLAQVVNYAPSIVSDKTGRVIYQAEHGREEVVVVEIQL